MRSTTWLLLVASTICSSTTCQAGGFFRRVPEVGEWARYEMLIRQPEVRPRVPASHAMLTLKCVGEEQIDNSRHLWLETQLDCLTRREGSTESSSYAKILVPENQIVDGDIAGSIVRGWTGSPSHIIEVLNPENLYRSRVMRIVFSTCEGTDAGNRSRAFTINEERVRLANEVATLPTHEFEVSEVKLMRFTGEEVDWWPSEDHAFGIVSALQTWKEYYKTPNPFVVGPATEIETTYEYEFFLAETGTNAVSEFPERDEFNTAAVRQGGGLVRRLPEVGEWAAYGYANELTSWLLVCVAEEDIEGVSTRLISFRSLQIRRNDPVTEILLRFRTDDSGRCIIDEVISTPHNDHEDLEIAQLVWMLFSGPEDPVAGEQERTLEVPRSNDGNLLGAALLFPFDDRLDFGIDASGDAEGFVATRTESGRFQDFQFENAEIRRTMTAEGTWWLSEDLAFGVAACDIHCTMLNQNDPAQTLDISIVLQGEGIVDLDSVHSFLELFVMSR